MCNFNCPGIGTSMNGCPNLGTQIALLPTTFQSQCKLGYLDYGYVCKLKSTTSPLKPSTCIFYVLLNTRWIILQ